MSAPGFLPDAPTSLGPAVPQRALPAFDMRAAVTSVPRRDRPTVYARLNAQKEAFRRLDVDDASRRAQLDQLNEEMARDPEVMAKVRARMAAPGPAAPQMAERTDLTLGEGIAGLVGGLSGGRWADAASAAMGMADRRQQRAFGNEQLAYQAALADRQRQDQASMLEYQELLGDRQFRRQQISELEREGRTSSAQRAAMEFNARLGDIDAGDRREMADEDRDFQRETLFRQQSFQRDLSDTSWYRQVTMRAEDRRDAWAQLVAKLWADPPANVADARTRIDAINRITGMANAAGADLPAMDEAAAERFLKAGREAERFALERAQLSGLGFLQRQQYGDQEALAQSEAILRSYPRESPEYARAFADRQAIISRRGGGAGGAAPPPMQGSIGPMRLDAPGVGVGGGFAPPIVETPDAKNSREYQTKLAESWNQKAASLSALLNSPPPRDAKGRRAREESLRQLWIDIDTIRVQMEAAGLTPPPLPKAIEDVYRAAIEAAMGGLMGGARRPGPAARPPARPGNPANLPPALRPQGGNRIIGVEED